MATLDGGGSQTFGGMRWEAAGGVASCAVALLGPATSSSSPSLSVPLQIAVDNNGGTNSDVQIVVATDAAFTNVVWPGTLTNVVNGNYTVQPTGLVVTTMYYWRARAAPTGTTSWGPWSETRTFAVDLNTGKAWGYSYENVGIEPGLWYSGNIESIYENVGVEETLYHGGIDYLYENVGVEITPYAGGSEYVYEGDVDTSTPTPLIWFLQPASGRVADGIEIVGFGFGDLQTTYGGQLEIDLGGVIGWQPLAVVSWQTFPPTVDAYTAGRQLDVVTGTIDMQHQKIGFIVPSGSIPPGYPVRVVTNGA